MRGRWLFLAVVLAAGVPDYEAAGAFCDPGSLELSGSQSANGRLTPVPSVRAYALNGEKILLDGVLDEAAWELAEPAWGFRKWDPARGDPSSEETAFKVAYDDEAIYFGVACYEQCASNIRGQLCRRDHISDSDIVSLYLDTYHDHSTGFNFRVNALGVKGDRYVYNDGPSDRDWHAVWEVETSQDENGWYAEFRIPFSCVRYGQTEEMIWGCNVYRYMHSRGEDTAWTIWDTETRGFISRFGEITGLIGVPHSRQLELVPYTVTRTTDPAAPGSPDEDDHFQNFGLDLKYGLTSNFTLNAAFQPDFGQVEVDPSQLNLSPFETYYDEKRPFFIEGNRYFEHPRFNVFYSRRIGTGDENSRIRVAGKLTGKTAQGVTVAALYAATDVTDDGQAHNFLRSGEQLRHYLVGRFGKEFVDGAHRVNIIQTGVFRTADRADYGDFASRDAWTTAMDFDLNFHDRDYNIEGSFVGSVVDPAKDESDPSTSHARIYGTGGNLGIRKLGGAFMGGISGRWESDKLDLNDAGFLRAPDETNVSGWMRYEHNSTCDDALFLRGNIGLDLWKYWLYAGNEELDLDTGEVAWSYDRGHPKNQGLNLNSWGQLSNYWNVWGGGGWNPDGTSKYATRTFTDTLGVTSQGPLVRYPSGAYGWMGFSTDYRLPLAVNVNLNAGGDAWGGWSRRASVGLDWTATEAMTYSLSVSYGRSHSKAEHLDNFRNPGGGVGGVSYVFAEREQQTVDATFRSDILFSRDLSLQLYAQPYLTVGSYGNPRELVAPDTYDLTPVVDVPGFSAADVSNYDFRYFAMNVNAVLRWEYRPGSTFYLVWKQGRSLYDDRFGMPTLGTSLDPGALLDEEPENVFLAKVTYWFSI
ncbi:carbohydrate binding family 9 domain-containing protein [bacterium]|nr:carbohydrate binding family 9 domain-containing protein [bacterium]